MMLVKLFDGFTVDPTKVRCIAVFARPHDEDHPFTVSVFTARREISCGNYKDKELAQNAVTYYTRIVHEALEKPKPRLMPNPFDDEDKPCTT